VVSSVRSHDRIRRRDIKLAIKVVPGASRNGVAGWLGDVLKVRVTAPPERGKANAAVETTIAAALSVPTASVRVVAGHGSPRKVVEIDGFSEAEIRDRLAKSASVQ
jgi:uncharacterized protein (TIGR00251 family)